MAVQSRVHEESAEVVLRTDALTAELVQVERMVQSGAKLAKNLMKSMAENRETVKANLAALKERVAKLKKN